MNNSTSFDDKILAGERVKCPKCGDGYIEPKFPEHKRKFDYKCTKCDYHIHFDAAVIVE